MVAISQTTFSNAFSMIMNESCLGSKCSNKQYCGNMRRAIKLAPQNRNYRSLACVASWVIVKAQSNIIVSMSFHSEEYEVILGHSEFSNIKWYQYNCTEFCENCCETKWYRNCNCMFRTGICLMIQDINSCDFFIDIKAICCKMNDGQLKNRMFRFDIRVIIVKVIGLNMAYVFLNWNGCNMYE